MHAAAQSYQRPRARTRVTISTSAILTAIILAMMLVGAAYVASEIVEHTRQTDQQALAGVR
ncbi:MAG: hypothetical protein AB9900_10865 [Humidesulfovibrio sp.]